MQPTQRHTGDVCILQTLLLSLSCLTVRGKQLLNNGCNPLSSTETLSSPLFKSPSPSLSGHTPLLLIIKCRNTAPCFITCATPEMINNPCLVTIYHVLAGREEEMVMKCPITTRPQPSMATALPGQDAALPSARLQVLSL